MPNGIAESRLMRARQLAPLALRMTLLFMPLAACSSGSESMTLLVTPGKYQYHNCEQLSAAKKSVITRRDELKGLITQAERSAGGVFVGAVVYRSEYESQIEEVRVIDAAARDKDCLTTATWRSNSEIH